MVNFANGDMVGHTGNFEAATKAVEAVDEQLGRIVEAAKEQGYAMVLLRIMVIVKRCVMMQAIP